MFRVKYFLFLLRPVNIGVTEQSQRSCEHILNNFKYAVLFCNGTI